MKKITKIIIILFFSLMLNTQNILAEEKIKIGLLVPLSGENSKIGKSIIKSINLAINKINNPLIEILPRDTKSNPSITLRAAKELSEKGIMKI